MKVLIPTAGEGTRLRPLTITTPKPLLRVAGKPVIAHILDRLLNLSIEEIILIVGYQGERVANYVRANYPFSLRVVEQRESRGLGHAVAMGIPYAGEQPLLIILGDTILDCDFQRFERGASDSLGVHTVDDPRRFGVAEIEGLVIRRLVEKPAQPRSNQVLVGLYFLSNAALLASSLQDLLARGQVTHSEFQITDALQLLIERGVTFQPCPIRGWYDCGEREALLQSNRRLLVAAGAGITGIDATVEVVESRLARDVCVAQFTKIIGSQIRNSIIGEESIIEECDLDSSLIGNRCHLKNVKGKVTVGDFAEIVGN